ncbi:hypothetical protein [Kineococcus aurantiacus]|uniref:Uncharacterized protein n=1 Tax=Kineococcus aurantiacus TaxID=37633 RepID=A0A7Y9DLU4_9ACTN|nr:hypothetical protein [Kineococcus aurantiacus]NYD23005.1 hypothetical protein [Kineococcus aurantiacus]
MAGRQTLIRTLHDAGLAAWFGGSLFGAVGLNGAAAAASDPSERTKIASAGWGKWAPVNAVALAAHTVGGIGLIAGNAGRVATQKGAGKNTVIKSVITLVAMGVTGYSGLQGVKLGKNSPTPAAGATEPSAQTPQEAAQAQKRLKVLQWTIPALTGVLLVMTVQQGEQQKPSQIAKGLIDRVRS